MTVKDYLGGLFDYSFKPSTLASIMEARGLDGDGEKQLAEIRNLELARADLLIFISTSSHGASKKVQRGNRSASLSNGSYSRLDLRAIANSIYKKWDEPIVGGGSVYFKKIFDIQ